MKKLVRLSVIVLACTLMMTSCNKEGQYNPKQKISKIVDSYTYKDILGVSHSTTQSQVWHWAGDHLSYIDYGDDNGIMAFHYDEKDRVDEMNDGYNMFKYFYNGNLLEKIEFYKSDYLSEIYTFERDGKNIVKIFRKIMNDKSAKSSQMNPFTLFLPENAANLITAEAPANVKGTMTYELTWDGKNISRIDAFYDGEKVSYNWSYDEKTNPFKCLLDRASNFFDVIYSENNVVEEIYTNEKNVSETTTYQYVYDGKYPVKKSWADKNVVGFWGITVVHVRDFTY